MFDQYDVVDVDANHLNALYPDLDSADQSKYYTIDDYNNMFSQDSSDFSLMHLNVRSLYSKLDLI